MASRNKKGKLHGIFKSQYQISFFYKPSMEGSDIYYYMILEDIIFLKLRFVQNSTLVIEDLHPLTSSYMEREYERLFLFLKEQSTITVLVSLIGNIDAFRQTCLRFDAPVIEDERFLSYPESFYQKFKNYCGNDVGRFGFFLLALNENTFKEELVAKEEYMDEEKLVEEKDQPISRAIHAPKEEIEISEKSEPTVELPNESSPIIQKECLDDAICFLKDWIHLYQLNMGGDTSIYQPQKRFADEPDFELVWIDEENKELDGSITMSLVYDVTDAGYSFHVKPIISRGTSIINLISMLKSLVSLVDERLTEGNRWTIYIPVSQESQIHHLLIDLKFHQMYNSGNCVPPINTNMGMVHLHNIAMMVYPK